MSKHVLTVTRPLLREAYDLVLGQWPDVVVPGEKSFHLGGGCNMRTLNDTHFSIEEWVTATDFRVEIDEIISSVEFYVYQTIHNALKDLARLQKADLDFEAFVSRFDGHPSYKVVSASEAS